MSKTWGDRVVNGCVLNDENNFISYTHPITGIKRDETSSI